MVEIFQILFLAIFAFAAPSSVTKSSGPPLFLLQDYNDGLCLAGSVFKRCSSDTLWYVRGKPGTYQIHKKHVDEEGENVCFGRSQCHLDNSTAQVLSCSHCGTKKWNILGDSETGYIISTNNKKLCMSRVGDNVHVSKCSEGFAVVNLHFLTTSDQAALNGDGAQLTQAASENNAAGIVSLLNDGVDINARDWYNVTALIAAASKGHVSMVNFLIARGAKVNLHDKDNVTAIMEACFGGHTSVTKALYDAGADYDTVALTGVTALWLAAKNGHKRLVEFLLSKGANPSVQRADGISALMAACVGGHTDVVRALLLHGAEVNVIDNEGYSALSNAADVGNKEIVQLLLNANAEVNNMSPAGFSPLIVASAHGHTDVVKMLLEAGADLETPDHPEGATPLMYAAAGGFPEVVDYLISQGATVNKLHKHNNGSALLEASSTGNVSVVTSLLKAGGDPMVVDDDGVSVLMSAAAGGHSQLITLFMEAAPALNVSAMAASGGTPLMFAAGSGHYEAVKLLLEYGAEINAVVSSTEEYKRQLAIAEEKKEDDEKHLDGVTALMLAASEGHLAVTSLLIEHGANVTIRDAEDMSALEGTLRAGYVDVATLLVEHGANPNDSFVDNEGYSHNILMDAINSNNTAFACLLIEKGANANVAVEDGVTPIIQASYLGMSEVVKALIQHHANASAVNNDGVCALIAAASEGHVEVIEELMKSSSISVDLGDADGTTALMAAAVRGHANVVDLLLSSGASVNLQNSDGHTALMFAYNGKNQIETLLLKYKDHIKDGDESLTMIHEALTQNMNVISSLMKYGADKWIKDNTGHVASDFDFTPPIPDVNSIANEL